jgi:hypothetical protein
MSHFKLELAYRVFLAVSPVVIDPGRRFECKTQCRPLRARNANPRGLFGQRLVYELIAFVKVDLRFRLQFLQRCNTSNVIEVCVSKCNCLKFETVAL